MNLNIINKSNCKAWVVFKKNEHVATVRSFYSKNYVCLVNVVSRGDIKYKKGGSLVEALQGLYVENVELKGYCSTDTKTEKILNLYKNKKLSLKQARKKADKIGAYFANWKGSFFNNLYYLEGLERLTVLGYTVIQAI